LGRTSPFRTRACTAVVNKCNQIIQTAHKIHPRKRFRQIGFFKIMKKGGGDFSNLLTHHIYNVLFFQVLTHFYRSPVYTRIFFINSDVFSKIVPRKCAKVRSELK
jgi:hypothetical protein